MISIAVTILVMALSVFFNFRYRQGIYAEQESAKEARRQGHGYPHIPSDPPSRWWIMVLTVIVGFVAFGLMVLVSLAATSIFRHDNIQPKSKEVVALAALQDSVQGAGETSGSFFLGIGSVYGQYGPEVAFSFYEQEGGSLYPNLVAEDGYNAISVQQGDYVPHVVVTEWTNKCHTPGWLNPIHELCSTGSYETEWTFYVPRETVLHDFKLDAR